MRWPPRDLPRRHPRLSLDAASSPGCCPRAFTRRALPDGPQIVPSASIAGNALTVVIAIMSFLACLTAGAVYMVNQSANAWVNDIASEITVELDPVNTADIEKKMTLVSLFLAKQKGITQVKPLTADDSAKLLEPWLGKSDALCRRLPIPRLIAVEIDRSNPPDIKLISEALTQNFEGVTLDDHRRWQAEIKHLDPVRRAWRPCRARRSSPRRPSPSSSRRPGAPWRRTARSSRCCISSAPMSASSAANSSAISSALASAPAWSARIAAAIAFLLLPVVTHMLGGGIVTADRN